jgi:hypothetical protein
VTAADLLDRLQELGLEARVEHNVLRLRGRGAVLETGLREELRLRQAELAALLVARHRRQLRELGDSLGWPALELTRGIKVVAGWLAWSAFLATAGDHHVKLALAALGSGPARPAIVVPRPRPVAGAIPCPACGNAPFTYAEPGPLSRRCDGPKGCGHLWPAAFAGEEDLDG